MNDVEYHIERNPERVSKVVQFILVNTNKNLRIHALNDLLPNELKREEIRNYIISSDYYTLLDLSPTIEGKEKEDILILIEMIVRKKKIDVVESSESELIKEIDSELKYHSIKLVSDEVKDTYLKFGEIFGVESIDLENFEKRSSEINEDELRNYTLQLYDRLRRIMRSHSIPNDLEVLLRLKPSEWDTRDVVKIYHILNHMNQQKEDVEITENRIDTIESELKIKNEKSKYELREEIIPLQKKIDSIKHVRNFVIRKHSSGKMTEDRFQRQLKKLDDEIKKAQFEIDLRKAKIRNIQLTPFQLQYEILKNLLKAGAQKLRDENMHDRTEIEKTVDELLKRFDEFHELKRKNTYNEREKEDIVKKYEKKLEKKEALISRLREAKKGMERNLTATEQIYDLNRQEKIDLKDRVSSLEIELDQSKRNYEELEYEYNSLKNSDIAQERDTLHEKFQKVADENNTMSKQIMQMKKDFQKIIQTLKGE